MGSNRRLSVVVDVPSPCEVDWEDMVGDERARFCGRCSKTVTNLSVLNGDEIAAVLERGDCVSFLYRDDASIVTKESCTTPSGRPRDARFPSASTAVVVLAATMAMTLGCGTQRSGGSPLPPATGSAATALPSTESASVAPTQPVGSASNESTPAATQTATPAPSASCTPDSKTQKAQPKAPLPPRRTAGVPARHSLPDFARK